jgi:hypothetical protein
LGREHDVPFELSALVERIYQRALARYGPADGELLAVALLEEQAGLPCVTALRPDVIRGRQRAVRPRQGWS